MGDSKGIRAGKAYVELFADKSKLVSGLKSAGNSLKEFGGKISGMGQKMMLAGTAAAAPLVAATRIFSKMGDDMNDMSARTGVSVEALSELSFAADRSGTSAEGLETGLKKMQKNLAEAAGGSRAAQDALGAVGLTIADLQGLSPDQQFKLIAEGVSRIQDPSLRAAAAMDIFGKSGTDLLPLMADGAKGIEDMQARARQLGLTMSGKDAAAASAFDDAMVDLNATLKMAVFQVGAALQPVLQDVVAWLTSAAVSARNWIDQNRGMIVSALKIAAGAAAAGGGLFLMGKAVTGLGVAFKAVSAVLPIVGSLLSFLLTPMGLVIGAAVALGAYLLTNTETGGKALGWLGERFDELKGDALTAYGGISDALAAGDIGLAAQVLWTTLKKWWHQGTGWLLEKWYAFKAGFLSVATDAFYGVWKAFNWVVAKLEAAFTYLKAAWDKAMSWIQEKASKIAVNLALDAKEREAKADLEAGRINQTGYEIAMRSIAETRGDSTQRIEAEGKAAREAIDRQAADRNAAIDQELAAKNKTLDEASASLAQQRTEQLAKELQGLDDDVAKATAARDAAVKQAAANRQYAKDKEAAGSGPGAGSVQNLMDKVGPAMAAASKAAATAGTFNAAAVAGLGMGDALQKRIAAAVEKQAQKADEMANDLGDWARAPEVVV